jgi:hypothetical protein
MMVASSRSAPYSTASAARCFEECIETAPNLSVRGGMAVYALNLEKAAQLCQVSIDT